MSLLSQFLASFGQKTKAQSSSVVLASDHQIITTQGVQDTNTSGTITSGTSIIGPLSVSQRNVVTATISGTYAGVTVVPETSLDGVVWTPIQMADVETSAALAVWVLPANKSITLECAVGAASQVRLRATTWTSGTANVTLAAQSQAYEPIATSLVQWQSRDFVCTNVTAVNNDLFSFDTDGAAAVRLQLTGTFAGTLTFQGSNDGTTWSTVNAINASSGAVATTATAVGIFEIPLRTRYIRARVTTYTSGTWGGVYRISTNPTSTLGSTQAVSGTVTANIGTGALAAGTNAIGDVGLQVRANATGAATTAKINAAASTNATSVKATAGRLLGYSLSNTTAAFKYVRLYNLATAPTVGTSVPVLVLPVPPNSHITGSFPVGLAFSTGIAYSITGASADLDNTAVAALDVLGGLFYA